VVSIFQKVVRKGRRRRRGPDGKTHGITDAGIRLLAQKDYEAISMARIAREAGCSVGALYARFPEKNAYLYHVVASAYRTMASRAATELEVTPTRHLSLPFLVRLVVEHAVNTMTSPRAAGVIRATIKLSTVKPITIELFEDYRMALTRSAVAVLSPRVRGNSTGAIRLVMQIVIATITDAVLQPRPGPMAAGRKRMKDALMQIMLGYLGVSKGSSWAGEEADGEDEIETNPEVSGGDQDGATHNANGVYDPDLRVFRKRATEPSHKSGGRISKAAKANRDSKIDGPTTPASPKAVKPAAIAKAQAETNKPKRKHPFV
jgi:AcrR family transcriptional regulator